MLPPLKPVWASITQGLSWARYRRGWLGRMVAGLLVLYTLCILVLAWLWSAEPDAFDVQAVTARYAAQQGHQPVIGYTTTYSLMHIVDVLLHKSGGYLSDDISLPGIWLDNMPNWEFGVLVQVRDFTEALRSDFSRSQSQSTEDPNLAQGEPLFKFTNDRWLLPSSKSEYRKGYAAVAQYLASLADQTNSTAQFYARADNLRNWFMDVETRLGSLSQRLSASVGQLRINTDLAGDPDGRQATPMQSQSRVRTPWNKIDDVFYEARGTAWALIHLLKAVEIDFGDILLKKNALVSLRQIIRELEATQVGLGSPIILNGSGFGMFANHSLVMANYISRANAAIIDLRTLLEKG